MFDISWIDDTLAVGGALPTANLQALSARHGVRHVIDVRAETHDDADVLSRHGIRLLWLPTRDFGAVTAAMLDQGVDFIIRGVADGERVLVHCQLGIGRSVLLVLCCLVQRGARAPDAMLYVKDRRPQASPSPQQIDALLDFEERLTGVRSDFDDVARHAYRHIPNWRSAR